MQDAAGAGSVSARGQVCWLSFWGRFQQSLLVGYEGSSLVMLLTSSLQRCSTAAYVTTRNVS